MTFENQLKPEKAIPYYEETQKRTFAGKIVKVKNTIFSMMAYSCPINKWRIIFHRWRGVHIGKHVYIGIHCFLDNLYPDYIYIDDNASINAGTMILTHFNPMKQYAPIFKARVAPVIVGKKAIVAVRSLLLPGVTIGESAIVSAGSIVDKDVPPYTLVRGNPAKKVTDFEFLITN